MMQSAPTRFVRSVPQVAKARFTIHTRLLTSTTIPFEKKQKWEKEKMQQNDIPKFEIKYAESFARKSTFEIGRAFMLLHIGAMPMIVRAAKPMINAARATLGDKITDFVLEKSFAAQYTGGATIKELLPMIDDMNKHGIGAILDYAAEADPEDDVEDASAEETQAVADEEMEKVTEWALGGNEMQILYPQVDIKVRKGELKYVENPKMMARTSNYPSARTFIYASNTECDANKQICEDAIRTASSQKIAPFAAIKITALLDPFSLISVSKAITELHSLFPGYENVDMDANKLGEMSQETFLAEMRKTAPHLPENWHVRKSSKNSNPIAVLGASGTVDFVDWMRWCDDPSVWVTDGTDPICFNPAPVGDQVQVLAGFNRAAELARVAEECGVRMMIDAEQTYIQPTIDLIVRLLQYKLNTTTPVVWNTYQCYRKDARHRVKLDQELFKREGVKFGCKFVRGAYVVQERNRAMHLDYEDPICATLEDTHAMYDSCVEMTLPLVVEGKAEFMLASHNKDSVEKAAHLMEEAKMPPNSAIYFGQLLGMGDHITDSLAAKGFNCYKYVPYGPVKETVPYLIRRVEENSTMLAGEPIVKERAMMFKELKRRLLRE